MPEPTNRAQRPLSRTVPTRTRAQWQQQRYPQSPRQDAERGSHTTRSSDARPSRRHVQVEVVEVKQQRAELSVQALDNSLFAR